MQKIIFPPLPVANYKATHYQDANGWHQLTTPLVPTAIAQAGLGLTWDSTPDEGIIVPNGSSIDAVRFQETGTQLPPVEVTALNFIGGRKPPRPR